MISFLTSEAGLTLVSLFVGWFFRWQTEGRKHQYNLNELAIKSLAARDDSMDRAYKRDKDGGTWMRRAIYILIAIMFIGFMVAGFLDKPLLFETEVTKGALFWKRTVVEYVNAVGVFFPPEIRKAFLMLCAFYLGQGVK